MRDSSYQSNQYGHFWAENSKGQAEKDRKQIKNCICKQLERKVSTKKQINLN
jgi:hypothetical protein